MQRINNILHYSLIEIQLRLYFLQTKQWFGDPNSYEWRNIIRDVPDKNSRIILFLVEAISDLLSNADSNSFSLYQIEEPRFPSSLAEFIEGLKEDEQANVEIDHFGTKQAVLNSLKSPKDVERILFDELFKTIVFIQKIIWKILIKKICQGEVLAYGVRFPSRDKLGAALISSLEWVNLTFQGSEAVAKNEDSISYKYCNLVFIIPVSKNPSSPIIEQQKPGRPSIMKLIETQMQKRFDEGMLCNTLAMEARALELWGIKAYPKFKTPKAESIAKQTSVRSLYYQLNPSPLQKNS
jgi:hypothetical protein